MWIYEKRLQFPVKISRPNPALAKLIITQYGGRDGFNYKKGQVTPQLSQRGNHLPVRLLDYNVFTIAYTIKGLSRIFRRFPCHR